MEILALLIWLACGFISSSILSSGGRSGCGGFLIGFVFGPLGVIIALLINLQPRNKQ
jgi:hypothetical protein